MIVFAAIFIVYCMLSPNFLGLPAYAILVAATIMLFLASWLRTIPYAFFALVCVKLFTLFVALGLLAVSPSGDFTLVRDLGISLFVSCMALASAVLLLRYGLLRLMSVISLILLLHSVYCGLVLVGLLSGNLTSALFISFQSTGAHDAITRFSGVAGIGGAALSIIYAKVGWVSLYIALKRNPRNLHSYQLLFFSVAASSIVYGRTGILVFAIILLATLIREFSTKKVSRGSVKTFATFLMVLVAAPLVLDAESMRQLRFWTRLMELRLEATGQAESGVLLLFNYWYDSLSHYLVLIGDGDFGRVGFANLPDPGIIRQLSGAGLLILPLIFLPVLYVLKATRFSMIMVGIVLFDLALWMKEWFVPGMLGVGYVTELFFLYLILQKSDWAARKLKRSPGNFSRGEAIPT